MRTRNLVALVLLLVIVCAGAAYALGHSNATAKMSARVAEQVAENARLLQLQEQTAAEADSLEAAFDSLKVIQMASAMEADSAIAHWRRLFRTRVDQPPNPPGGPAVEARFEELQGLLVAADSTITVCDNALNDCEAAVAQADSMRVAERSARFAAAERAAVMENNWSEAQARIDRILRWRPYREAGIGLLGLGTGLAACFAAGGF